MPLLAELIAFYVTVVLRSAFPPRPLRISFFLLA
jgi:hypothetical protein